MMATLSRLFIQFFVLIGVFGVGPVYAKFELLGTKKIIAQLPGSKEVQIGEVLFTAVANKPTDFVVTIDHSKFTDYFLSMREFKCLEGAEEVSCHVPYPYKNPKSVTDKDYAWLEHHLMFMFKKPNEFGAKLWNGIYFKFEPKGDELVGTPQAIDLNLIGAPPNDFNHPPYQKSELHDINIEARLVKAIVIR